MGRLAYSKPFLNLIQHKITSAEFIKQIKPLYNPSEFKEVTAEELGKFKTHEENNHGKSYEKYNIRYKYFLAIDGTSAYTEADAKDIERFIQTHTTEEFINLMIEVHKPEDSQDKNSTDALIYNILTKILPTEDHVIGWLST